MRLIFRLKQGVTLNLKPNAEIKTEDRIKLYESIKISDIHTIINND